MAQVGPEIILEGGKRSPDRALGEAGQPDVSPIDPLELVMARAPSSHGLVPTKVHEANGIEKPATARAAVLEAALVEQVVRRVTWGGDRRRGIARIELDGDFAGTTILLRGEGRSVELEVTLGPGLPSQGLPERLAGRLRARGLDVVQVGVR